MVDVGYPSIVRLARFEILWADDCRDNRRVELERRTEQDGRGAADSSPRKEYERFREVVNPLGLLDIAFVDRNELCRLGCGR